MRKVYLALLSLVLASAGMAQEVIPLTENTVIQRYITQKEAQLPPNIRTVEGAVEKTVCPILNPDVTYVESGQESQQLVLINMFIDTTAILICDGCNTLQYGAATIMKDSIYYQANSGVESGIDTLTVKFCEPDGSACYDSIRYYFVVHRPGRHYYPPTQTLQAEDRVTVQTDPTQLPGELKCNFFVDCPDNYEGRAQRTWFTTYSAPDYQFVYESSRYAGLDSVCVGLCDEFAVCDTFHFSFRIQKDTVSLPFMDDFSYPGPFPDADHWLDIDVFVNNTMAELPPSLGVATFDGLNPRGTPYGGSYGDSDYLTSTYLNLNGVNGDLTLTYWLQRRGLVDRPETQDSLVLEFRDATGQWVLMRVFQGISPSLPNNIDEPFHFYATQVPPQFRYKGFQFRFRNYSDRAGINDNWHLDYVRLDATYTDSLFNDVAFTQLPAFILKNYTSMPWRHFKQEDLGTQLTVGLYNHANQALNASPSGVSLIEQESGVNAFGSTLTLFNGTEANIPNGMSVNRTYQLNNDPTGFPAVLGNYQSTMTGPSFDGYDKLDFQLKYTLNNTSQINQPGFEAVQRNDQVTRSTIFDNYFAYDDGSAEATLVTAEGNQVAVKFTTAVEDTLRAVRMHLPHSSTDVSDQTFRIRVWKGQLDNSPDYQMSYLPYYADNAFDTLQGFTTYPLVDEDGEYAPLVLPPGDFYVGWQQVTACDFTRCVGVGYDKNQPQGKEAISRNSGQGWEPLSEFTPAGALMIRPVVGSTTPGFTPVEEPSNPDAMRMHLYPNPATDLLNIVLSNGANDQYLYRLFNANGQLVQQGELQNQLNIAGLPNGVYWFTAIHRERQQILQQKLVILHY